MALATATGLLIVLLFTVSIRSMFQGGKIQQLEWDVSTVTAGDYSAEFPIKAENYAKWKQEVYKAPGGPFERGISPALALKEQLSKEIEEKLDKWVNDNPWAVEELFGKSKKKGEKLYKTSKVADIVFSFNNARLIEALRARGAQIAAQDFDKMREEEQRISELFQEFDSLTVPTSAFITFESDDSSSMTDLIKETDITLLDQPFKF